MPMKIKVSEERFCCEPRDIVECKANVVSIHLATKFGFCRHCGQLFAEVAHTDAAGSTDWEWRPIVVTAFERK